MNESYYDLPTMVQQAMNERSDRPEDARIITSECRECGSEAFYVEYEDAPAQELDASGRRVFMDTVEDTASEFFHIDGNELENPHVCPPCSDELRHRADPHHCVVGGRVATVGVAGEYVHTYVPWFDSEVNEWDNPLSNQRIEVLRGETDELQYHDEPLVEIELFERTREEILAGSFDLPVTGVLGFENESTAYLHPDDAEEIEARLESTPADELPECLRTELKWGHTWNVTHEAFHGTDGREDGFDLTSFGDADTFEAIVRDFGLRYDKVQSYADREDRYRFLWYNDEVLLTTGNNPLTGEYNMDGARSPEPGYASYMSVEGETEAVRTLSQRLRSDAEHVKEFTTGESGFI
jgi:hypothetical protein